MTELNTNGLPDWAADLLSDNQKYVRRCYDSPRLRHRLALRRSLPLELVYATLEYDGLDGLELVARIGGVAATCVERRWKEYGAGWREAGSSSATFPEIQMDSGIPMGDMYMIGKDPASSAVIKNVGTPLPSGDTIEKLYAEAQWRKQRDEAERFKAKAQFMQWSQQVAEAESNRLANYGWLQGGQQATNNPFQGLRNALDDDRSMALQFAMGSIQTRPSKPTAPKPPDPPEPRSKNGRLIRFETDEDE
jgi:hypothetical protein